MPALILPVVTGPKLAKPTDSAPLTLPTAIDVFEPIPIENPLSAGPCELTNPPDKLPNTIAPPAFPLMLRPDVMLPPVTLPVAMKSNPSAAVASTSAIDPPLSSRMASGTLGSTDTPPLRSPSVMSPPELMTMLLSAVMLPESKVVPALAWKLPVATGPLMVIDPPDATGSWARIGARLKVSNAPPSTPIELSARYT